MFGEDPIEPIPDRAVIVEVDAAGERDGALRDRRLDLRPIASPVAYNQVTSLQRPLFAVTHPQGAGERLLDRADAHVAHLRPTKKVARSLLVSRQK